MADPTLRKLMALAFLAMSAGLAPGQQQDSFETGFRRFADRHCVSCHGPDVQKRKLRLDKLPATFVDKDTAATWIKVLDRVSRGEMPPKGKPRPTEQETK